MQKKKSLTFIILIIFFIYFIGAVEERGEGYEVERKTYLDGPVITQNEVGLEIPVDGRSCNRKNPRRVVHNRIRFRSRIAGGADHQNAALHGVECADGNGIVKQFFLAPGGRTQRQRQHIHSVGNGIVKRRQNGLPTTSPAKTRFVNRQPRFWGPTLCVPRRQIIERHVSHDGTHRRRRHVGPMAIIIPWRVGPLALLIISIIPRPD